MTLRALLQEMNDPFFDLRNHKEDIVLEFHFRIPEVAIDLVKNNFSSRGGGGGGQRTQN